VGLVRVWVQAFWDLVLTALKERGIMPARLAHYLSVYPRIAASAMVGAVALVAVAVTLGREHELHSPNLRRHRPGESPTDRQHGRGGLLGADLREERGRQPVDGQRSNRT
jgi:hypothetical protein